MNTLERTDYHLRKILRMEAGPASWPRMILCALATGAPLLAGLATDHLLLAIYGALTGYMLSLNDHFGVLGHRLWTVSISFLMMLAGFAGGVYLQGRPIEFILVFAGMTYWLGLLGGEGAEFERGALFALILLLVSASSHPLNPEHTKMVFAFATSGYLILIAGMIAIAVLLKQKPDPHAGFRESFRKSLTLDRHKHIHAFGYALTTLLAFYSSHFVGIERAYWTAITVLLVMKPDRVTSIYRSFQRFIGTVAGVAVTEALLLVLKKPLPAVLVIITASFLVPWAIRKNYWLLSFLVSVIALLLLDLPFIDKGDFHTPLVRLYATSWGCLLGLLGVLFTLGVAFCFENLQKIKQTRENK